MNNNDQEIKISSSAEELKPKHEGKNTMIFSEIIKWCIYALVALLPLWFLPFTGNVLNLNKQVLMIILLTIALIAWLGKLLTQDKIKWYKGKIVIFFLAFVVMYGLATIFSLRPYDSLMGSDNPLSRALINVIYFFILFILLINHSYSEKNEKGKSIETFKLLTIFLGSSLIVGLFGFFQVLGKFIFTWDFTKATSFNTIGTTTSLGIYLAILLPLVLSLFLSIRQEKEGREATVKVFRIFLALLAILSLVIVLLLNARVLWIITAVGMIMIIGFWLNKRHVLPAQTIIWLSVPVIILAFCLIFLFFKPSIAFNLDLPLEVGLAYKGGINVVKEAIKQNPILGSGPETFIYNYSLYKPLSINQTIFWNFRFVNAPAEILNLITEIGILGILAFLVMIVVFLSKIVKGLINIEKGPSQLTGVRIGLFCSWIALIMGWFLYPQNITLMFVFWLFFTFLVILSSGEEDVKVINLRTSEKIASLISFGFIILMIIIIGFLYLGGSKFIAEAKFKQGLNLIEEGKLDSGINKITRATITNPYEDKFYRNLTQLFLVEINQDLADTNLEQQDRANRVQVGISNAINSAVRATTLNSKDVVNWIIRGSVYRNLIALVNGAGDWAVKSYQQALKLEPSNPFIYTEIARVYVNAADLLKKQDQENQAIKNQVTDYLNKAIENYGNSIELKSDYAPAHFEVALVYDKQGKVNEAIVRMENTLSLVPRDTGVAFQLGVLYYKASQFDKAKTAFIRAVSLDSNYSNARYFLGLLFDREGNKQAAIEQFEKIAELNPDNNLVKQILANLKAGKSALGSPELGPPAQPEEIPIEEKQPEESRFRLPTSD